MIIIFKINFFYLKEIPLQNKLKINLKFKKQNY